MRSLSFYIALVDDADYRLCRRLNRGADLAVVRGMFAAASRLGDGAVWYALMLLLPLGYGARGLRSALVMGAVGVLGLALYKGLKKIFVRERPFVRHRGICLAAAPLDRYSFPSGHTLHATAFTWQACSQFPELAIVLVPLAALIATSRCVLGLHYPTDVLVGGLLGAGLGALGVAALS
jgi:undecaprenyl-diphosphatase